ncbi:hypothetical protein KIL84_021023 [Mauremys mutica]|uniref:Grh/CP2 DB domain-containing protein n=1 Tax=Mauremys mutica TaxID=74926 RepID=A0A9D3X6L8_9SAUR|nr:hypothetical protein KIL84_021023 [Mauremys mutica]
MAWALKLPLADEVIESGLVQDFDASLSGIGQELGAGAYSMSDVLALPIFKQEESSLPPDNENKILPFQYVLCAATSPAVKLHDETLTYLNQGQSYEIRMLDNRKIGELPEINGKLVKVSERESECPFYTDFLTQGALPAQQNTRQSARNGPLGIGIDRCFQALNATNLRKVLPSRCGLSWSLQGSTRTKGPMENRAS